MQVLHTSIFTGYLLTLRLTGLQSCNQDEKMWLTCSVPCASRPAVHELVISSPHDFLSHLKADDEEDVDKLHQLGECSPYIVIPKTETRTSLGKNRHVEEGRSWAQRSASLCFCLVIKYFNLHDQCIQPRILKCSHYDSTLLLEWS